MVSVMGGRATARMRVRSQPLDPQFYISGGLPFNGRARPLVDGAARTPRQRGAS